MIPRASSPDYSPNAKPTTGPSLLLLSSKQNKFRFFPNPPLNNKPISATTPPLPLTTLTLVPSKWCHSDHWKRNSAPLLPPFFFPLPPSPAGQRVENVRNAFSRSRWCRKTVPGGTLSLRARLHGAKSRGKTREIGMRRKRGFPLVARAHPRTCAPTTPWRRSTATPFGSVVRQISRSYGNTMVDDVESGGSC